jgi:23S rRNA pseudouridine1911/1915/1917 synthase
MCSDSPRVNQLDDENLEDREHEFQAETDCSRLDVFIKERLTTLSRGHIQRLIKSGSVALNGVAAKSSKTVRPGDWIRVSLPPLQPSDILPEDIPLDIIFEDGDLIVVNKPKGMTVHPAPNQSTGTLVNALLMRCGSSLSGINGVARPGIVHRIDKDTSGLLVVAKTDFAHNHIAEQIKLRETSKKYTAVVHGAPAKSSGRIETLIARNPRDRKKMCVAKKDGRDAITLYETKERFCHFSELDVRILTGRTHQIRVHLAHIGCPVAGDGVYGGGSLKTQELRGDRRAAFVAALDGLQGQALHAREISFRHPATNKTVSFSAPPSPDIAAFINFLKENDPLEVQD